MASLISRVASILLGCIGTIMVLSMSSIAQEAEGCYIKTASGQVVLLNKLCESKSRSRVGGANRMKPGEVKRISAGAWTVMPGGDKPVHLPNGITVHPDTRLELPGMEGWSMKPIVKNGEPSGVQLYKPDGSPMQLGEFHKLSSGQIIKQEGFK